MGIDVEVDVDIGSHFGCFKGVSESVKVLRMWEFPKTQAP